MKKVKVFVAQSCPTLCAPVDCSPPGSSVHEILQARVTGVGTSTGDLPYPGLELTSAVSPALQADALPSEPPGKLKTNESCAEMKLIGVNDA